MTTPLAYSVIICTYNRAEMLALCLRTALADARSVQQPGEIIVVDNASTDGTRQVVAELSAAQQGTPALRYVLEPVPGLARARNRGLDEAGGDILAFLDDDAIVHPAWLCNCLDAFAAYPEAAAVGGEILPRCVAQFPSWFRPPLTKVYSVVSLDGKLDGGPDNPGWLKPRSASDHSGAGLRPYPGEEHPLGANMAFRRKVFSDRRFSLRLGRTGGDLMGSEESEIFFAIRREGQTILYAPGMCVEHEIAPARLSEEWAVRRYWFDGVCRARLRVGWRQWLHDATLMAAKLGWLAALAFLHRGPFERLLWRCRMAKSLGFFAEVTRAIMPLPRLPWAGLYPATAKADVAQDGSRTGLGA